MAAEMLSERKDRQAQNTVVKGEPEPSVNGMRRGKQKKWNGFTLTELLVVVAIIAILVGIGIPVFSAQVEKARAAVCATNRRSLVSEICVAQMLEPTLRKPKSGANAALEALWAEKAAGMACPSGGTLVPYYDAEGYLERVSCSRHEGGSGSEEPPLSERQQLKNMIQSVENGHASGWKAAVAEIAGGSSTYTFPEVGSAVLKAYQAAGGVVSSTVKLTWKPAVTTDGRCAMVATVNTQDQTAVTNAYTNASGSYDRFAYVVFDGTNYYVPLHSYTRKPNPNYVSDNSLNLDGIQSGTLSIPWVKLTVQED